MERKIYNVFEFNGVKLRSGTKVLVGSISCLDGVVCTETYFFGAFIERCRYIPVFHKIKKDGTMSKMKQHIRGVIISINKI